MKINVGCGLRKMAGYVNVDASASVAPDVVHNLNDTPYPFPDGCASVINARAIMEHVRNEALPNAMRELQRILVPGGLLYLMVPFWNNYYSFRDPTHYTHWDYDTINFFTKRGVNKHIIDYEFATDLTLLFGHEIVFSRAKRYWAERASGVPWDDWKHFHPNTVDALCFWLCKGDKPSVDWKAENAAIVEGKVYPNGYRWDDETIIYYPEKKVDKLA